MKNSAILIVEGDEILHQDLKGRLFRHGFEVIEALDKTTLQFFQARKPDLVIICSSGDSSSNGLKTVAQIRRQDRGVPRSLSGRDGVIASLKEQRGFSEAEAEACWQAIEASVLAYGDGDMELGYQRLLDGPESRHSQWCSWTGKC